MSRPRLNILRNLRLQLKTGYLREEPIEYNYMRRYPPLSRDTIPLENRLKDVHIPYVDLYRKAVSKNPLYLDEKVFPAFGAQEPQALILAKRQYQYMQDGLSEEAAYQKALEYVDEVEDAAFHKINEVQSAVQTSTGAKNPFVSNAEVAKTLADWQSKLQTQSYDELTLQEQGELDYFVQTKILGWNEVERERRMKDPVFVLQFEKLMFSLLPQNAEVEARSLKTFQDQFKENFLTLHNYNLNKLTTMQPFYVEDYLHYLSKVQSQPDLSKWEGQEREEFSKWIIDTLAYRDGIENRNAGRIQYYLDAVRDQFFPTLRFPSRAKELTKAFSVKDVKALLYNNEIGYKKENDKLYVKRFYRLPALLFPRDIMCTRISLNEKYLSHVLESKEALVKEMKNHGVAESEVEDVERQLLEYSHELQNKASSSASSTNDSIDMSVLDDILGDNKRSDHASEEDAPAAVSTSSASNHNFSPEEWNKLVRQHVKLPKTSLDMERHNFYNQVEYDSFESAKSEDDLIRFKTLRMENELIVRARLARKYEKKEAARRLADWESRKLFTTELPPPAVPLMEA